MKRREIVKYVSLWASFSVQLARPHVFLREPYWWLEMLTRTVSQWSRSQVNYVLALGPSQELSSPSLLSPGAVALM